MTGLNLNFKTGSTWCLEHNFELPVNRLNSILNATVTWRWRMMTLTNCELSVAYNLNGLFAQIIQFDATELYSWNWADSESLCEHVIMSVLQICNLPTILDPWCAYWIQSDLDICTSENFRDQTLQFDKLLNDWHSNSSSVKLVRSTSAIERTSDYSVPFPVEKVWWNLIGLID